MPNRYVPGASEGDRVYHAIKARAIAYEFGPGEPIRLNPLAAQLGVSTTPIRAALNMLAAEGLVTREPQKGFVAMAMSEERFAGLYRLNYLLLDAAVTLHKPDADSVATAAPTIAGIGDELDSGGPDSPDAIAGRTGRLFACLAQLSNNPHVVESVERINDSLCYLRVLEHRHLDDIPAELMNICELFTEERLDGVAKAIADYHDRRLNLLPKLLVAFRQ